MEGVWIQSSGWESTRVESWSPQITKESLTTMGSCPYFLFNLVIRRFHFKTKGSKGQVMFANSGTPLIILIFLACEFAAERPSAFDGSLPNATNVGAFSIETHCPLLRLGSAQRHTLIIIMNNDPQRWWQSPANLTRFYPSSLPIFATKALSSSASASTFWSSSSEIVTQSCMRERVLEGFIIEKHHDRWSVHASVICPD